MIEQDLMEQDATFMRPDIVEAEQEVEQEDSTLAPMDRHKLVRRIATDTAEPLDVRHSASRLLELADVRPASDFNYRFAELMELRDAYQKENDNERL